MVSIRRWVGWRLGLYRFKFWLMGVVAVSTEKIGSLATTRKVSRSFPMNTCSPVSINRPMTFATEPVAFREVYEFPIIKSQLISVFCIMTVEAPSHCLCMVEFNLGMFFFKFPFFPIDFHGGMAVTAGINPLCQGWGRYWKLLIGSTHKGDKANP